jgi:hypothetical protein
MQYKKVLCFTTSYRRQKFLRGTIFDMLNQTYNDIVHSINLTTIADKNKELNKILYDDLISERVRIIYSENLHQHYNHLNAIMGIENYEDFDIFVKIDDDDIYKKNYIQNIVNFFNNNDVDMISSKIKYQLNGHSIIVGNYDNLGGNPKNCDFKMPFTFAFNKNALNLIKNLTNIFGFEDSMWRESWCNKIKIMEIDNTDNVIWNIHGKNTSTSDFLNKKLI